MLAARDGACLLMGLLSAFAENTTNGHGFIALVALVFGCCNPIGAAPSALLLGFVQKITFRAGGQVVIPAELLQMIPYIITIVVLAGFGGRTIAPDAIGKPCRKK